MTTKILVVDDEEDTLKVIASNLAREGYAVDTFSSPAHAMQRLHEETYDTILLDYQMPEMNGIEFLKKVKSFNKDVPVILITGYATIPRAVEAMTEGAYHYLTKPLNYDELKIVLRNSVTLHILRNSHKRLEQELQKTYSFYNLIGKSKVMKKIFYQIKAASKTDSWVLIQGEKGTGKETIAKTIHNGSKRKDFPFVSFDCSLLPQTLLDEELIEKTKNADKGSLFLEEVQCLPADLQVKFFHVLEGKEFNARVLSGTTEDLQQAVNDRTFHKELFQKLNVFPIMVPPLRERKEDIPLLASHFLKEYSKTHQKDIRSFSPTVYAKLLSYDFPENVGELERLVERACVVCQCECIELEEIPGLLLEEEMEEESLTPFLKEKQKTVENFEREYLVTLLTATKGKISEAAKVSGLAERNIYEKLKRYGLKKEEFKEG